MTLPSQEALPTASDCLIIDGDGLESALRRLTDSPRVYVDCETDGLSRLANKAIGVSVSDGRPGDGQDVWARYVPWGHDTSEPQAMYPVVLRWWQDLVKAVPAQRWRVFNKQFDFQLVKNALGVLPAFHPQAYDVFHLAYLVDETLPEHKLKKLGQRYIDPNAADEEEALKPWLYDIEKSGHKKVPPSIEGPYAAQDARLTAQLDGHLYPMAEAQQLLGVLELETNLLPVVMGMEQYGVLIDPDYMEAQRVECETEAEQIRARFERESGWAGSINSPDQLRKLIYEDWELKPGRMTRAGEPSTDKWAIERLIQENPARAATLQLLRDHSKLQTLLETFFGPIPLLMDGHNVVHTLYKQMVRTGRMSAGKPNIQQMPAKKEGDVRSDRVRRGFRPRPGYAWVLVDYSQIELRVLAHYSQSPRMMQAYADDEDIHAQTAELLGIPRKTAKNVNFAQVYGAGVAQLARTAGVSEGEASLLKKRYAQFYPEVKRFTYRALDLAKERGWVKTVSGRRRRFADKHYRAGNTVIQGSAADIMKQAMVMCHQAMAELGPDYRLVATIHDELIFEVPQGSEQQVVQTVRPLMTSAFVPPISVPIRVDASTTVTNWADEEEVDW